MSLIACCSIALIHRRSLSTYQKRSHLSWRAWTRDTHLLSNFTLFKGPAFGIHSAFHQDTFPQLDTAVVLHAISKSLITRCFTRSRRRPRARPSRQSTTIVFRATLPTSRLTAMQTPLKLISLNREKLSAHVWTRTRSSSNSYLVLLTTSAVPVKIPLAIFGITSLSMFLVLRASAQCCSLRALRWAKHPNRSGEITCNMEVKIGTGLASKKETASVCSYGLFSPLPTGSVHSTAWNAYFPTVYERFVWQVSASFFALAMVFHWLQDFILNKVLSAVFRLCHGWVENKTRCYVKVICTEAGGLYIYSPGSSGPRSPSRSYAPYQPASTLL